MVRQRQLRDRHSVFAWMLTLLLIMQAVLPLTGVSGDSRVYAASPETAQFELDVSDDMIYYGDWFTRLMQFKYKETGDTERAYCMNPELFPPREGTHTATIYNYKNVPDSYRALWKALYYLEGGPGYPQVASVWDSIYHYDPSNPDKWNGGREQVYALSHMVVSEISPVGSTGTVGAGAEYIQLMNAMIDKISIMPDPPKTFQIAVYVSDSSLQNVTGYCAPLSVTGTLRLTKHSADTAITAGNALYSLAGAEYGVYADSACTTKIASFVTDADGKTKDLTLEEGTYYVREEKASPGYVCDQEVHKAVVTADETTTVASGETPQRAVPEWLVFKIDRESGRDVPKGAASLEGAVFEVAWYAGRFDTWNAAEKAGVKNCTWHFKTDAQGKVAYDPSYLADGDALLKDRDGNLMLPCGTVFVRETAAPEGYLINEDTFAVHIDPVDGQSDPVITAAAIGQTPSAREQIMRGGFRFNKLKEGSAEAVSMVPFRITSLATGESHILVSDANGIADTESYAHATNCNGNDGAVLEDGSIDESLLDPSAGIWFTGYADAAEAMAPDNGQKALPYDTYLVEELRCTANDGYRLASFQVRIDRDQVMIDRGTVTDYKDISISTTAVCEETGTQYAPQIGTVTVTDTVRYEDAKVGEVYRLVGVLMDRETGEPVVVNGEIVTAEKEFAALHKDGKVKLSFEVDAADLAGKTTVVFETLYRDGEKAAEHADLQDEGQTVRFPVIATQAARTDETTVVDHVSYQGLKEGETYTMTAHLIDQKTEKVIRDVEGSIQFTAEKDNGTVDVPIDVTKAGSGYRVVFERCTKDDKLVALHEDAGCKEQTVLLPEKPGKPETPEKPEQPKRHVPRTGDPGMYTAAWLLLGIAALTATVCFAKRQETAAEE